MKPGRKIILFSILIIASLTIISCNKKKRLEPAESKSLVKIGRLICGGHLSLAIVENLYQKDLTTFNIKSIQNHDWNDVVNDVKSGKLAGTFILSPLAMNMIRGGLPAKIVMMADRNGNGFVLSRRYGSVKELAGQNAIIAVPHIYSQHHILLYLSLKQHGVPYKDVTVIGMPPRDMITSLRRGEIDGFVVGEPEANKSVSLNVGWMAAISPEIWRDHPDHLFIVSNKFIKEHGNQVQQLINALKRGGIFIEKHPHQAAVMGEGYTGSRASVFEKVLTDPEDWIDYSDMIPSYERLRKMAELMVEMGLWNNIPDNLASYIDQRFILNASTHQ